MKFCTNCNSPNLHQDLTQGHLICLTCGTILKESITVESLTFSQNTLTGQLINLTSKNIHTTYNIIQTTLNTICQNMTLPESFAVNAFKWYKLSLRHHLSKGKNILYTLSACLYIVCRQEKSTFMIVDFSTALRIDCVKIGKMYLKLCRFLLIKVNFIDPSFYIHRYSHQLGVKTDIAYRVLKWMKRDWIVTGRRPNNICGAALLLASRIENKKVLDINEVAKVVKASVVVINRRLEEIGDTETANMTVEGFMRVWIEKEEDPPIVKKRMKLEMERLEKLKSMREEEIENMENVICTPVEDDVEMKDINVGVIDKGFLKQEDFNEFEDDSEIDNCLLTEEESMMKEKMWNEMYEDYMKEKESKIVKVKQKISNGQKETEKKQNSKINTTAFDILF